MVTLISLAIAFVLTIVVVVHLGIFSLLTGTAYFFLGKPRFNILKTAMGPNGFAFSFDWNNSKEPSKFNLIRIRLFNPFGKENKHVDVSKEFSSKNSSFAEDVDFGVAYRKILTCDNVEKSRVNIEVCSPDGLSFNYEMPTSKFISKIESANDVVDKFNQTEKEANTDKVYYHTVSRSHVVDQVKKSSKTLKIASNPEFAGEFQDSGSNSGAPVENFKVAKVWIEDGCIVCNACEAIMPEVFEVKDDGCIILPAGSLDDGLKILESADACPVEIIKFDKAS